jgi:CubicO group peptidase (beta-lactamase class C family)
MGNLIVESPEKLGLSTERLGRIMPFVAGQYVNAGKLPGVSTLVARRGQVAHVDAIGQRDIANGLPLTLDTIVRIYSMTKPITSVALMALYEEGRFQLDDPVSRFVPAWANLRVWEDGNPLKFRTKFPEREMTIRDLLTHTSGLSYGFMYNHPVDAIYRHRGVERPLGLMAGNADPARTTAELVDKLTDVPLLFSPGTQWAYSVATDVCGRLVEIISGQPLDLFVAQRVTGPLGMVDTAFHVTDDKLDRFAACYSYTKDDPLVLTDPVATSGYRPVPTYVSGGGGMVSTMSDYLRFCTMLLNRGELDGVRILGRKTVELMTMNHLPGGQDMDQMAERAFSETSYEGVGFGLGFAVVIDPAATQSIASRGTYSWGGAASTGFWIDPTEELIVIVLTQLLPSSTYPVRRELQSLVYAALID